ncbi:MAG: aromatic ring-hydroxylating dioxygenase subunit alpha [Acidimicrobiales bacterium]|nr:aromatic ring-hydroxylating dioxygenase subunit alpha [Acidimicrobiales bacterium]
MWPRAWQVACSADHVARPGDFFEYTVGRLSVVVVRGQDGELRAFQNACLHRGNELCSGTGGGLTELRCPFHRWSWTLDGQLREVPSRKGFGVIRSADYELPAVQVDTWGRLVWINLDPDAGALVDYLDEMPAEVAWADLDDFRCTALLTTEMQCNWKTLIDGFSETYHVQGIHPEMLPMVDDVNSPQVIWDHVGRLQQPYGIPSPRLRNPSTQLQWDAFVAVMGGRLGLSDPADAGEPPEVPDGSTMRDVLAARIRRHSAEAKGVALDRFTTDQLLTLLQYNVFPNVTILVFGDLLQVVKSRPGTAPDRCFMDIVAFERAEPGAPDSQPATVSLAKGDVDLGLVLNQDVDNIEKAQRGLYQPGFTHLSLSGEECRIANLHRNLDRYIDAHGST